MRFRKTYIEITNVCNRSCGFCPGTGRPAQYLSAEVFGEVLGQLDGLCRRLHLHVMGEALLHPDVGRILDICNERGFEANLVTNGWPLASRAEAVLGRQALRQVGVSLHSLGSVTDEQALREYFGALRRFVDKAAACPRLSVSLRMWNEGAEPASGERILAGLAAFGIIPRDPFVRINRAPRFEWPDVEGTDHGQRGTCQGLREQVAILADGTVVPCCLDRNGAISLGNVMRQPLAKILAGDRAVAMREGFGKGLVVEALCRRCSYRLRFGRSGGRTTESSPGAAVQPPAAAARACAQGSAVGTSPVASVNNVFSLSP